MIGRAGHSPASEVRLNEYELLYIVHPRKAADEVPSVIEWVSGLVQQGGGEPLSVDDWGRRRLAYPIAHEFEATYVLATFRLPPESTASLESQLVISEDIMRHLLIHGIIPFEGRREEVERVEEAVAPAAAEAPAADPPAPAPEQEPPPEQPAEAAVETGEGEEKGAPQVVEPAPAPEQEPPSGQPAEAAVETSEGEEEQGEEKSAPQVAEPSPATAGAE